MGVPLSDFDYRTDINAAEINFYVSGLSASMDLRITLLKFDPRNADAQVIFSSINSNGYEIARGYVDSTGDWFSTITGNALTYLEGLVYDEVEYVFFGFESFTMGPGMGIDASRSYGKFEYDDSAPNVPRVSALPQFSKGSKITVYWSSVTDLPTGGSTGGVEYVLGIFVFPEDTAEPTGWSSWTPLTSMDVYYLEDGMKYYFRVVSSDANGFVSSWSSAESTTMDASPPTVPAIWTEPMYTAGTSNRIQWTASTDAGVGGVQYEIEMATTPDFNSAATYTTSSTSYTFSDLASGTTYYYRVRAKDSFDHYSEWSTPESSYQDDAPPSVPELMPEPLFSPGTTNMFNWHPSRDAGVGVKDYRVQVATQSDFMAGTIVLDVNTNDTFVYATNLADGTTYYVRVRAVDAFGNPSAWSASDWTIQDASGPGMPGLASIPPYHTGTPIHLVWGGAEDDGIGVAYYEVSWSTDSTFQGAVTTRTFILGHAFDVPALQEGLKWYIRVMGYDYFDNPGIADSVSTSVDATPPSAPVVEDEPPYSAGTTNTLTWTGSTDDFSGIDHYMIRIFSHASMTTPIHMEETQGTSYSFEGMDGIRYWYKVIAVDRAGNEAAGNVVSSVQDASPPSTPLILSLDRFTPSTQVILRWHPSTDSGSGGVEYKVQWSTVSDFTSDVNESSWTDLTTYMVNDLEDSEQYHIRLYARDALGQESVPTEAMATTIDVSPPTAPTLTSIDDYTASTVVTLSWSVSTDGGGGPVRYQAHVYTDEMMTTPWAVSPYIYWTSFNFTGLVDGVTYYFSVSAEDSHGWRSSSQDPEMTTIDITPPVISVSPPFLFAPGSGKISGMCWDSGSGVRSVMVSGNGGINWIQAEMTGASWSVDISELTALDGPFHIEGKDMAGNIVVTTSLAFLDASAPLIEISSPADGSHLSGVVPIIGSIWDVYLEGYSVDYMAPGASEWTAIQPHQSSDGVSGVLATWVTEGLHGGQYDIRVTATDDVGHTSEETVTVQLRGARLYIGPSDIVFSNPHPLPGEKVMVYVTVHNDGAAPANGVNVVVVDGAKELGRMEGLNVPEMGIVVVPFELKAKGSHKITARATSDLYDSGAMTEGTSLETIEEEAALENAGGILGLLGVVLAIIAILLAILLSKRSKGEVHYTEDEEHIEAED